MSYLFSVVALGTWLFTSSIATAGPLASAPNAYMGGSGYEWRGSSPVFNAAPYDGGVMGHVDWAVFLYDDSPEGMTGFAPPLHYFLFAYQVFLEAPMSQPLFGISSDFLPQNPGTFTATGIDGSAPAALIYDPDNGLLQWRFDGSQTAFHTLGLAVTSSLRPDFSAGVVWDGDLIVGIAAIPIGSVMPEPSSFALAMLGAGAATLVAWRRRRSR